MRGHYVCSERTSIVIVMLQLVCCSQAPRHAKKYAVAWRRTIWVVVLAMCQRTMRLGSHLTCAHINACFQCNMQLPPMRSTCRVAEWLGGALAFFSFFVAWRGARASMAWLLCSAVPASNAGLRLPRDALCASFDGDVGAQR